jgi:hypothetical protein
MRTLLTLLFALLLPTLPCYKILAHPPCGVIDAALSDYQHIKTGITRRDVDRYFELDGGLQFPSSARYVYPKCRYLHLDIEFEAKGNVDRPLSPDDKVVKASRLYVDYPVKD